MNPNALFPIAMALIFCAAPAGAQTDAADRVERGALILENVPDTPPALADRIRQYQETRSAGLAGFPADGDGILIATRFAETAQIHHVAAPLGARRQLTFFDEPVGDAAPSPADAALFAFARDAGGDENYQIFLFDRADGAARRLSDGAGRKGSPVWSENGSRLAWYTTLEGTRRGIVVADPANPEARRTVFEKEAWMAPSEWSPDGSTLLLFEYVSINESYVWLLDVETGEARAVNPSDATIAYGGAAFSHDGKSLYLISDEDGEFRHLYRYDIASGEKTNLTPDVEWDVSDIAVAPNGASYAFTVNEAGRSSLYIRRAHDDRELDAPRLPAGVVYDLDYSPDGATLAFTLNSATGPGDVYSWAVGQRRAQLTRWTQSEVGGLNPDAFIEPETFSYRTFDEVDGAPRRIPAFIYRPEGAGPHPVIISIHGGPEGQSRPTFSSTYQFWANELGAAVIVPNVRGSTGFGKTYVTLDNGRKREDSVKDIGALLDWVGTQNDLDADRIAVYGGSYGGYMVLASMTNFPDRLAGGVDIVGISSFVTFLENTAEYRKDVRRPEYGDERDPEMRAFLEEISPLNKADRIAAPLFIIQGLNDPRVPASEAEQILAAMKANGVEAWYMAAKDEGHGFRKKSNRDAMTEAVALFLEKLFEEGGEGAP